MKIETLDHCNICGDHRIQTLDANSNIWGCRACGYVFDNPRPSNEELIAFYSRPAKYDSWLSEEMARDLLWKRRIRQLLRVSKPGSLLDVGAGIGQFLSHARPFFTKAYGTEVSESAIDIARERYNLDLIRGEVENIDFGSMQVDNVTLFHVLEHVPDPKLVIEKCRSLLPSGGIMVIAVPNDLLSLRARVRRFLRAVGVTRFQRKGNLGLPKITLDGSLDEIHLSHFTPAVLKRLLTECGFTVVLNSLDPYYAAVGLIKWKQDAFYWCCRILRFIFAVNFYDTILVAARKQGGTRLCSPTTKFHRSVHQ